MEQSYQTSALNALLPSSLQLRIPSFRRSFSSLSLPSFTRNSDISSSSELKSRGCLKGAESPGLSYNSQLFNTLLDNNEIDHYYCEIQKCKGDKLLNSPQIQLPKATGGGIIWKLAYHGFSLLKIALSESASSASADVPFARQLYIHSLTYLIRALPPDLTIDERISIQVALPGGIIDPQERCHSSFRAEIRPTSFLHRTLASTIVQLFIMFQLILPHIRFLLAKIWAYQSEQQIIVRMTRSCIDLVLGVGEAMKGLGETRMGEMLIATVQWWIEGVVGGIGEGISIIEALGKKDNLPNIKSCGGSNESLVTSNGVLG